MVNRSSPRRYSSLFAAHASARDEPRRSAQARADPDRPVPTRTDRRPARARLRTRAQTAARGRRRRVKRRGTRPRPSPVRSGPVAECAGTVSSPHRLDKSNLSRCSSWRCAKDDRVRHARAQALEREAARVLDRDQRAECAAEEAVDRAVGHEPGERTTARHGRASAPAEAHHAARDAMAHARLRGGVRAELPRPSRKACEGANLVARRRES